MNNVEFWLMNNPLRAFVQRYEANKMRKMTEFEGGRILEIGCGQGTGTLLIDKLFKPKQIVAIDLDPKMIDRAKNRVNNKNVTFMCASVTELPFEEDTFDAIMDFGILHHVPNWEKAITELYRVLKPGGEVILEDLSIETFRLPVLGWIMKKLLDHPYTKMFKRKEFMEECKRQNFVIKAYKTNFFWFNAILEKPLLSSTKGE